MRVKIGVAAILTAATVACSVGCGYVDAVDEDSGEQQIAAAQNSTESQTDEQKSDLQNVDEIQNSQTQEQTDSTEELYSEQDDSSVVECGGSGYVNAEFGFTLPLPDGTEFTECEDVLKASFEDDEIQFRALMNTSSNDDFSVTVQLYETAETLDDFCKARWEYVDNTNEKGEDSAEILDTSNDEIDGKPAQVITEKLVSGENTFYTLRTYVQLTDTEYIFIQGNCYDEATLDELRNCSQALYCSTN